MTTMDLEHIRRNGPYDVVRAANPTDVAAAVVGLGERYEESGEVNFDELLNIGIMLTATGHESSDETIIGWFEERRTATRLDISAALLCGIWFRYPEKAPVSPVQIARFVDARPRTRLSPDAEYSYALALSRVLEDPRASSESFRIAGEASQESVARGTGLPAADARLASLVHDSIERAQNRANSAPLTEFVAYDRQEQGRHHLAIEHTATNAEVVRVLTLLVKDRMLLVEYRISDPRLTDDTARALVFHAVLLRLCRDAYRSHVDEVRYVNLVTKKEVISRYAPLE